MQDVLKAGGIPFQSISPQPARSLRELPDVDLLGLQVKGKCTLGQLARCLAQMRKAPLPVVVDQLHVSSDPKKPGNLDVTMVLATLAKRSRRPS